MSTIDYMLIEDALRMVEKALAATKDHHDPHVFIASLELIAAKACLKAALVGNEPEPA